MKKPCVHMCAAEAFVAILLVVSLPCAADAEPRESSSWLPPRTSLAGVVRWFDRRPLQSVEVKLHQWDMDGQRWLQAERTAVVDAKGRFSFDNILCNQTWYVVVKAPGSGVAFREVATEAGSIHTVEVTLRRAANAYIVVRDQEDRFVAGAKFRRWFVVDGTEGAFGLESRNSAGLGTIGSMSDKFGRLRLPELPEGVVLKLAEIEHPSYVTSLLKPDVPIQSGQVATCKLTAGIPVRFDIVPPAPQGQPNDLSELTIDLDSHEGDNPSAVYGVFPVDSGNVEFRIQPGWYQRVRVEAQHYYLTPRMWLGSTEQLAIGAGNHDRWTFRAIPKVSVVGRVLKYDGTPVVGASVEGEIENLLNDGSPAPEEWGMWNTVAWTRTDEQGEYRLDLAPGKNRIRYRGSGVPSRDSLEVLIADTARQHAADIFVRDIPEIRGLILGPNGSPAPDAVVRLFSASIRGDALTSLSDKQGKFKLTLQTLPRSAETGERVDQHQLFAYLPYASVGGGRGDRSARRKGGQRNHIANDGASC